MTLYKLVQEIVHMPLYEYRFLVQDGQSWEFPLTFSISDASVSANPSLVRNLTGNSVTFDVNKSAVWDVNGTWFYYRLFLEL